MFVRVSGANRFLGPALLKRYTKAVEGAQVHADALDEATKYLDPAMVAELTDAIVAWQKDPLSAHDPYHEPPPGQFPIPSLTTRSQRVQSSRRQMYVRS